MASVLDELRVELRALGDAPNATSVTIRQRVSRYSRRQDLDAANLAMQPFE